MNSRLESCGIVQVEGEVTLVKQVLDDATLRCVSLTIQHDTKQDLTWRGNEYECGKLTCKDMAR